MAVFGAPTALEDNAFRVCLAALGFRRRRSGLPSTSKSATVWTSGCLWDGTPVRQMQRVGLQFWLLGRPRNGGQRGPGRGADRPHYAFTHEIGQRVKCLVDVIGLFEAVPLVRYFGAGVEGRRTAT